MFCPVCQQDVPALAVPEEPGVVRCAICSEELEVRSHEPAVSPQISASRVETVGDLELDEYPIFHEADEPAESHEQTEPEQRPVAPLPPRPDLSDWDLQPQVRAAERLLKGLRQTAPAEAVTIHSAHSQAPSWHAPSPRPVSSEPVARREQPSTSPAEKSGTLAWTCLSLGVMALACGGVLVACSLIGSRDDLWSVGMPLAVVGQAGLVIGLLLQLEGLWRTSKKTEETLSQLDDKLHDLAHTTTMLGTTRSTPAQSFYVHMAEGASPHLLLADLKGQLDLLAERLARK